MKNLFVVLMLFVGLSIFSQETETVAETVIERVAESGTFLDVIQPYVIELLGGVDDGVDFIVTEAPIVIKQYLYFEAVRLWLIVILGIGFLTFIRKPICNMVVIKSIEKPISGDEKSYVGYKYLKLNCWLRVDTDADSSFTIEQFMYPCLKWGLSIIGVIIILVNTLDAIKVTF